MNRVSLLIEIGTEELPHWAVVSAIRQMEKIFTSFFKENHIDFESVRASGTPRRIYVKAQGVALSQDAVIRKIKGPPLKIAFNEEGQPQKALLGFLKQRKLSVEEIEKQDGYVYATVKEGGGKTAEILNKSIPDLIRKMNFKKTMRWGDELLFPRPIRWIVALLGDTTLNFRIGSLKSCNISKGNRFMASNSIPIDSPSAYESIMRKNKIEPDREKRKSIIIDKMNKEAEKLGGKIENDRELTEEVTDLLEYPGVVFGEYNKKYLKLPDIVVKAAMKQHQRYFPVVSKNGDLMPFFISTINNLEEFRDMIVPGMQRVLTSRLEDAKFYLEEDLKVPIDTRVEMLKDTIWIENIGTVRDKIEFLKFASRTIADALHLSGKSTEKLDMASHYCKIDLSTQMIRDGKEFTRLESQIAEKYALLYGIDREIASIIGEHLMPQRRGDKIPKTIEGAVLSIANKMVDIAGLVKSGYKPSPSKDPMGIRQMIYGIFEIITAKEFHFNFFETAEKILQKLDVKKDKAEYITWYAAERFENFLEEKEGIRYDIVDAIIRVSYDLFDVYKRALALKKAMENNPEVFEGVAIALKRVNNIITQTDVLPRVNTELFNDYEKQLYNKTEQLKPFLIEKIQNKAYDDFLGLIVELRPYIADFFDNVFVMVDDETIKNNRLALLYQVRELFRLYGDFSRIVV